MNSLWVVLLVSGVVTFLIRLSFIALLGHRQPPEWLRRGLRLIPPAVLTAIIVPEVLLPGGTPDFSPLNPRLWGALAAGWIAWKTKSPVLTVLAGMGVFYLARWIF